jgi:tetratricopeptide (TPR) repeat protein
MPAASATTEPAAKDGESAAPKKRSKLPLLAAIVVVMAGAGGAGAWWILTPPELPPPDRLKLALKLFDAGQYETANEQARKLIDSDYRDPDFPGGASFVVGMAEFHAARQAEGDSGESKYVVASTFLQDAEHLALTPDRRPVWSWALGLSLYRSGVIDGSIPLLDEAFRTYAQGRLEAGMLLLDAYLEKREAEVLDKALVLSTELLADPQLSPTDRIYAKLHRAQILIGKGLKTQADELLAEVGNDRLGGKGVTILRAQTLLDEKKPLEAIRLLEPLAADDRADRTFARQASYLMGIGALALNQLEDSVGYFEKTAERFEGTHEALAARLLAADSLRKLGRKEEALEAYGLTFRKIRRPQKYRNRWLDLSRVRDLARGAWNGWVASGDYAEAIALAEMVAPAIPTDEAHELAARANQMWAENLEKEVRVLPPAQRASRGAEVRKRFHDAGVAFARLAESRQSSRTYYDSLWTSAEDFFRAHEYSSCVAQIDRLLETGPANLLAEAWVRRAEARLNLGDHDNALADYMRVIKDFPTDPASITAQMAIGQVRWERNELPLAEQSWRSVLSSTDLRPEALEWRKALFSLSRLLVSTADADLRVWDRQTRGKTPTTADMEKLTDISARFSESILKLEEFLQRYPAADERDEAKFLLAKALVRRARHSQERTKLAETDSARIEYRQQFQSDLERSVAELATVRASLSEAQRLGRLDPLGEATLKQCQFEQAHAMYLRDDYEGAIEAYSSLAGKYQQDGEILGAYVQIANCFRRMNRRAEAVSTLAQARLLLKQMPETAFVSDEGKLTRAEWNRWLEWASQQDQ